MKEDVMKHIRAFTVGIFGVIALILLVGEPSDEETWFRVFFITKGLAFLFGYIAYALFNKWDSKGMLPKIYDDVLQ